jgi:hypothetical protein
LNTVDQFGYLGRRVCSVQYLDTEWNNSGNSKSEKGAGKIE